MIYSNYGRNFKMCHHVAKSGILKLLTDKGGRCWTKLCLHLPGPLRALSTTVDEARNIADFERIAEKKLMADPESAIAWKYINIASGDRQTYDESLAAFKRWRFQPRILTARPQQSFGTTLLGNAVDIPVGIAPVCHFNFLHPDGSTGAGRAASRAGALMIVSSVEDVTIDDFAAAVPEGGHYWVQTYLFKDRRNTLNIVRKAEKCGFRAIVVTVDSPVDEKTELLGTKSEKNVQGEQQWAPNIQFLEGKERDLSKKTCLDSFWGDLGKRETFCYANWDDLAWLKSQTKLPIVLKGVLTADSARQAAEFGVSGLIVSAHGGRQLDGSPAPLDALPDVVEGVKGTDVEVYMDGGVRTGNDVVKALALGARAVFIGRPVLYGHAAFGEEGVYRVLQILKTELSISMALNGCSTLPEITRAIVKHERDFHRH